ncbi:cell surface protein [Leuconostoc suionicum]|uniref:NEAT domain-containing protein n=1 Tax=Leuconostoc suionicum TaxID=1511761 RepID=UPI0021AA4FDF|nr:NEAT domain-containing protein [Leuconostoc suionicum]MCT4383263.1 cell surface protein [Leuconostoc suionicum]
MRRFKLFVLTCFSLILGMSIVGESISADTYSVPFRVVKDGSTETSVADQYFQNPATVAIDGDHYVVIMTIKTTHDLGLFPVSVTDFNGQTPTISRTTQGNTDYYQYQFTATSLDSRLDGHMAVNIQSIRYNHYYGYGVVFDISSLPKIGANNESSSSSAAISSSAVSSSSSVQSSSSSSTTSSQSSSSSKKASVKIVPHVSVSKKNKKEVSTTKNNKYVLWPWLLVIALGVALSVMLERRIRK